MIEVSTKEQLQVAMKTGETEIIILDEALLMHFRTIRKIKRFGPAAVAGVVAAVVAAVPTGGLSVAAFGATAATTTGVGTAALVALYGALGATVLIAVFSDWEEIEMPYGIKLRKKMKK